MPEFWHWRLHLAESGAVKIPIEVFDEICQGTGGLVDWVKLHKALLLWEPPEAVPADVQRAVYDGYARDLTEVELEKLGADPFPVAHALAAGGGVTIVTMEVSRPSRQRANRPLPEVGKTLRVPCTDTFALLRRLNFRTDWQRRLPSGDQP